MRDPAAPSLKVIPWVVRVSRAIQCAAGHLMVGALAPKSGPFAAHMAAHVLDHIRCAVAATRTEKTCVRRRKLNARSRSGSLPTLALLPLLCTAGVVSFVLLWPR